MPTFITLIGNEKPKVVPASDQSPYLAFMENMIVGEVFVQRSNCIFVLKTICYQDANKRNLIKWELVNFAVSLELLLLALKAGSWKIPLDI